MSDADLIRASLAGIDARCPSCGYDLAEATRFMCPECGEGFTLDELRRPEPPPRWLWIGWFAVCGLLVLPGLLWIRPLLLVGGGPQMFEVMLVAASLTSGGLPAAAMIALRLIIPDGRHPGRYFFAKFIILLGPIILPGVWILAGVIYASTIGFD